MKAIFYTDTRAGWRGLGNILVRLRLRSQISHCELMFEPGDGVDQWMPDGTTTPEGWAYWCATSAAAEAVPAWSPRRAGRNGGVRFKRIDPTARDKWLVVDLPADLAPAAARWFYEHQGALYDWRGIFGFLAWPIPGKSNRWTCHEACAAALGFPAPERTDPAALFSTLKWSAGVSHMAQPADGRADPHD